MSITDTVSVMRGGKVVANFSTEKTSPEELAENMVGRKVLLSIKKPTLKFGNPVLEVKNVSHESKDGVNVLKDISFDLREGEILGIAGVAGYGWTIVGGVTPDMGTKLFIVDSFLVVVAGGVGELVGVLCSGLGIGVITKLIEPLEFGGFTFCPSLPAGSVSSMRGFQLFYYP